MQSLKRLNKIIIYMTIATIIIFIILCIILLMGNHEKDDKQVEESFADDTIDYSNITTENVTSNMEFYSISNCIQNYYDLININSSSYYGTDNNGNYVKVIEDSTIKNNIYNLLSEKYISENDITKENVFEKVNTIKEKVLFVPIKMRMYRGENSNKYLAYGLIEDQDFNKKDDVYVFVNLDEKNSTYSIELINKKYENIDEITIENENKTILENENNRYNNPKITESYIAEKYFNSYKRIVLGDTKLAYEYLNEEYRNKKFGNYEEFEKYVKLNRDKIANLVVTKYSLNQEGNNTEYVCLDTLGNYYIFRENNNLKYEVILDTYTIDLLQFTEKYNKASEQEKVALNINKIITAIDAKDYKYVYSKLADSFKNNYFENEEVLKEYLEENLIEESTVSYNKFSREGNLYTYEIEMSKGTMSSYSKITMNVVMQLNEGTDFVMSFSIEK